jgi:hypothetical protein
MFDSAAADILAGWGLTVDAIDFNKLKASVPCPPNTYGETQPLLQHSVTLVKPLHLNQAASLMAIHSCNRNMCQVCAYECACCDVRQLSVLLAHAVTAVSVFFASPHSAGTSFNKNSRQGLSNENLSMADFCLLRCRQRHQRSRCRPLQGLP